MSIAVEVRNLTKRYRDQTALDDVTLRLHENTVTGLLGRNGAGKTTLMRLLAGLTLPTSGTVRIDGADPYENDTVLERICVSGEASCFPDLFRVRDVLRVAALAYPTWDDAYAEHLLGLFSLPARRQTRKLSRGMRSTLGIVVALASRAPVTLLDEPYLGLDAVARRAFYDQLLADVAEHPRTVVLSTHLIDEVSDLLERVVLIDRGTVLLDGPTESVLDGAVRLSGATSVVAEQVAGRAVLRSERLAGYGRATVRGFGEPDRRRARAAGLEVEPLSLQDLVVALSTHRAAGDGASAAGPSPDGAGRASSTAPDPTSEEPAPTPEKPEKEEVR